MVNTKDTAALHTQRRDLLLAAGCAVGLISLGAYCKVRTRSDFLRPPGALPDAQFLQRCLRCDRCRSVCPTGVITMTQIEDGLTHLRMPQMNHRHGYCDFCKKCIAVCPTGALRTFPEETCILGLAELTDTCIALRTGACTKCHEACPYDAIGLDAMQRPVIDATRCNGCGKCETICPANIFQSSQNTHQRGIVIKALAGRPDS